jgi:hypothetical protein
MMDDRRWRDSADAPDEVRALFAAGRPTTTLSPATRSRVARRLGVPVAGVVATGYALVWKNVAMAAMVGLATTVGAVSMARFIRPGTGTLTAPPGVVAPSVDRGAPHATPVAASAPTPSESPVAVPASPATEPAVPSPPLPVRQPPPPSHLEAPGDTLAAELALLQQARSTYDSAPRATLAVLNEHARRFPSGKLSLERELLALDTLKRLGDVAEERARAARLVPQVRGTIYEERVRAHLPEAESEEMPR